MASSSKNVADLAMNLYHRCWEKYSQDQLIYQHDLQNFNILPSNDLALLLECTQYLVDQRLFASHEDSHSRLAWKTIAADDAEKLRSLDQDELAVYNAVFAAGRAGLWHRSIQGKSNVLKADVERCIKSLEGKKLIKIVHVKSSKKKMYMLYWLQPSVDVTGGAWFTDGVLDSPFIFALSKFLEMHISKKSWYLSETPQSNKQPSKRLKSNAGEPRLPSQKKYLPYPAGYNGYPTVEQLTPEIEKSGITQTRMDHKSVQELLQVLCFDNKLVQNEDGSYRHLKKPDEVLRAYTRIEKNDVATNFEDFKGELGKNGMTEAPCGQCPVFKLCQPGGAVNPENCEYFGPWLQKALGF